MIGRPNVGKSTLFNRLTGTRDALVADFPGLTRDRLYGFASGAVASALVIDTGGLTESGDEMASLIHRQIELAVAEADVIIMLTDGQQGMTSEDRYVASLVRRSGKPVVLAVNKVEGRVPDMVVAEFYELGLDTPHAVSASRGDGVRDLFAAALAACPPAAGAAGDHPTELQGPRITVIGRPNVGKSTLINRLLREDRLVTRDEPGTTRDAIRVPFEMDGEPYTLVDTAGIRRRARVTDTIEKFSIAKSLQAVEEADAVIVLLDAREGVTEQDVSLIGLVLERGRALTIGINKWDGQSDSQRRHFMHAYALALPFLDFAEVHQVSALHGSNITDLFRSATRAAVAARAELPTPGTDAGAGRRGGHASAAHRAPPTHPPHLRPPGRPAPPGDRGARQPDRFPARQLSPLPGQPVPPRIQAGGHADPPGTAHGAQSVRRPAQSPDPAPGAEAAPPAGAHPALMPISI